MSFRVFFLSFVLVFVLALVTGGCSSPSKKSGHRSRYFDWPVDKARLTQVFKGYSHLGVDLAGPIGTPVFAAQRGLVIYTGNDFTGFGKMIIIEDRQAGWSTFYAHLDKILIHQGHHVKQGQLIGQMGNTGRSSGPHLHFEIRKGKKAVNPLRYLP